MRTSLPLSLFYLTLNPTVDALPLMAATCPTCAFHISSASTPYSGLPWPTCLDCLSHAHVHAEGVLLPFDGARANLVCYPRTRSLASTQQRLPMHGPQRPPCIPILPPAAHCAVVAVQLCTSWGMLARRAASVPTCPGRAIGVRHPLSGLNPLAEGLACLTPNLPSTQVS